MRVTFPGAILARISVLQWPDSRWSSYSRRFENRCNRRHCEFISIFNLIRNSFATIFQPASSPADRLREVDLSLDLFQTSHVFAISHGTQRHPFRYISLMELPYRSPLSSSSLNHLLSFSSYRCRFPVPFIRLISRYLLRLPSPTLGDTPFLPTRPPSFVPQNSPRKWWYLRQIHNRCPRAMIILRSATERLVVYFIIC